MPRKRVTPDDLTRNLPEIISDPPNEAHEGFDIAKEGVKGGRPKYDLEDHARYAKLPSEAKRGEMKQNWQEVAYTLVQRAKRLSQTATKTEFLQLKHLVLSAAIAIDKAFPPDQAGSGNYVFNLFGNLNKDTLEKVLGVAKPAPKVINGIATTIEEGSDGGSMRGVPCGEPVDK